VSGKLILTDINFQNKFHINIFGYTVFALDVEIMTTCYRQYISVQTNEMKDIFKLYPELLFIFHRYHLQAE